MVFLPLNSQHDRKGFDCGDADLNQWFSQIARQHKDRRISSTFVVVTDNASAEVLGYYAITIAELISADLPVHYRKRLPETVPAFRLGRLAVSVNHKGRRIGESLLFDAMDRIARISREVGGVGIVVNAKPAAIDFYKQYGFEQMLDHPLNLFLPV
ncbi:MAG: N-acetyltransferase [Betaproteobacteria bacterium HGW-Betaproteobacteria-11]|nr:MAG: N-acetyltransferase [Betaproteobacteria bacterium HGW-Betaproteobacteria-11]